MHSESSRCGFNHSREGLIKPMPKGLNMAIDGSIEASWLQLNQSQTMYPWHHNIWHKNFINSQYSKGKIFVSPWASSKHLQNNITFHIIKNFSGQHYKGRNFSRARFISPTRKTHTTLADKKLLSASGYVVGPSSTAGHPDKEGSGASCWWCWCQWIRGWLMTQKISLPQRRLSVAREARSMAPKAPHQLGTSRIIFLVQPFGVAQQIQL